MSWIQIKINSTEENAKKIGEWLCEIGALSVTFQDTFDTPIFEHLPGETKLWKNTDVIGLFPSDSNIGDLKQNLLCSSCLPTDIAYKIEVLEDKDWVREWMTNFHPLKFGEKLWICPSWLEIPDLHAANVILDPGLAFGTGTHPTTALCLTWLDSLPLKGKTIIDYGCGSGILAIAALKLGAAKAIGVDIDPQALSATLENARKNNVADKLMACLPENFQHEEKADVVVANILAEPLKELAPYISQHIKTGGYLGLSGILSSQAEAVSLAYRNYFTLDPVALSEEWCRISGFRKC